MIGFINQKIQGTGFVIKIKTAGKQNKMSETDDSLIYFVGLTRPGKTCKPGNHVRVKNSNLCKFVNFARNFLCKSQKKAGVRKRYQI